MARIIHIVKSGQLKSKVKKSLTTDLKNKYGKRFGGINTIKIKKVVTFTDSKGKKLDEYRGTYGYK